MPWASKQVVSAHWVQYYDFDQYLFLLFLLKIVGTFSRYFYWKLSKFNSYYAFMEYQTYSYENRVWLPDLRIATANIKTTAKLVVSYVHETKYFINVKIN